MLLQFDLKHIHKVNFYPSDNNFTQALLVLLVTNMISEDDIAECVGWCLIGRLCTLQLHIVLHCNCTLHSTRRNRQLVILCAGHLSAKCDHAAACGQNEIFLRHKVSKPLHLIRISELREKFLFTKPI